MHVNEMRVNAMKNKAVNYEKEHMIRIRKDLDYLCGQETFGRLSGTEGAIKAAQYIAGELGSVGLIPMGEINYFMPVTVGAARLTGPVKLKVDGFELRHRIDFDEFSAYTSGGVINGNLAVVKDGETQYESELQNSIVLIPEKPEGFDLESTIAEAEKLGIRAIIIEYGEPDWFYKTVYGTNNSRMIVLRIRKSVAEKLEQKAGKPVHIEVPIETGSRACNNVLGLLPGSGNGETVVFTAHYDHVGYDPGGAHFPGAFDNASGVAALLEIARGLRNMKYRLPFNILFAFLTGEESGLWGARQLAIQAPLPVTAVINVDGLGMEEDLYSIRIGHTSPVDELVKLGAEVVRQYGVSIQWVSGSDDSMVFITKGIPALGLGQQPTGCSINQMHKPGDTVSALKLQPIDKMINILKEIINKIAERPDILKCRLHKKGGNGNGKSY